jgi:hypothetical protein
MGLSIDFEKSVFVNKSTWSCPYIAPLLLFLLLLLLVGVVRAAVAKFYYSIHTITTALFNLANVNVCFRTNKHER